MTGEGKEGKPAPGPPFCQDTVAEASWGSGAAHVQSTATRRPRPQVVRARDASHLPFRLSARPSPGAPWARGLLSAFWERGPPNLPACGLRRGSKGGPSTSRLHQHKPKPLAGRMTQSFLRRGLVRLAHEEAKRSRRGTSRGAHDTSHDDQGCQAASPRSVLLSSLVQREQAQARASSKGVYFGATRPRPTQRPEGSHCGAQAGVTTRAFDSQGPTLVRIRVPAVPLQNGRLLAPFPLNIWEEAQGLCL